MTMKPTNLLIAEDSAIQIVAYQAALRQLVQFKLLHVAKDGEEALRYLKREGEFENAIRPDLVITDLQMPRKNGHELVGDIRNDERLKTIPVFMLSSSDNSQDIELAYKFGVNRFVTKPRAIPELVRTLESFACCVDALRRVA
jgi:CheY-like chemotaxis protein